MYETSSPTLLWSATCTEADFNLEKAQISATRVSSKMDPSLARVDPQSMAWPTLGLGGGSWSMGSGREAHVH